MTKQQMEQQIKKLNKKLDSLDGRRASDYSVKKLMAVSVLCFVFIVAMSLFGG